MSILENTNQSGDPQLDVKESVMFGTSVESKKSNLPKIIATILVAMFASVGVFEGFSYWKHKKEEKKLVTLDRYEAVGGRTYEGFIVGVYYDEKDLKKVLAIELLSSDMPMYLNHKDIPETSLRGKPVVLAMNREILKAFEKHETKFLKAHITHYVNKKTKDRINVLMNVQIIPPVEAPKPDMDKERTIFRHPETFEVIPKYIYEDIMREKKEKEEFVEELLIELNTKPSRPSYYTRGLGFK